LKSYGIPVCCDDVEVFWNMKAGTLLCMYVGFWTKGTDIITWQACRQQKWSCNNIQEILKC